ncbi:MAG: WYL domain-containing protein [Alcaligenaceae bacterium]|nr:WYL domain-containing protein [Alcaligenaceae bacterium]
MTTPCLIALGHAQRDRLAYIELRLWFFGSVRRRDLAARYGVQTAAGTRDLKLYQNIAPANMQYDRRAKIYTVTDAFTPAFDFSSARVLTWLSEGFGDNAPVGAGSGLSCSLPQRLTQPNLNTLAQVTRAISQRCPLKITYHSIQNGRSEREIVPFALLDTGLRWHVRAYDRKTAEFRDFVITRIETTQPIPESPLQEHEHPEHDIQWTRVVELELVSHPDQPRPEITCMDYGMVNGILRLQLRAATAGYTLRKWCVDCSPDHSLRGGEYRLWLKDHLTLYGVKNAVLAPGYTVSGQYLHEDSA